MCQSASNNLCGKLVLSLESQIMFDENFSVSLVPFFHFLSIPLKFIKCKTRDEVVAVGDRSQFTDF